LVLSFDDPIADYREGTMSAKMICRQLFSLSSCLVPLSRTRIRISKMISSSRPHPLLPLPLPRTSKRIKRKRNKKKMRKNRMRRMTNQTMSLINYQRSL